MELRILSTLESKPKPPPLWFVSDGDLTVGPVKTDLLVRGVRFGRIPDGVWVRELHWKSWRALWQVREVAAVQRELAQVGAMDFEVGVREQREAALTSSLLSAAQDPAEVLHFGLRAACAATRSSFGLLHRFEGPFGRATTQVVYGEGTLGLLGLPLALNDAVASAARGRMLLIGGSDSSQVHQRVALRLGGGLRRFAGVAMVPLHAGGEAIGFYEVGRVDHPYRHVDSLALASVADTIAERFVGFWN